MATAAVLGSHDALDNRMHLGAFAVSPASKPRRRRHSKAASPPPKVAAVSSPPVVKSAARVASPPPKAAAAAAVPQGVAAGGEEARVADEGVAEAEARDGEIRILKRGEAAGFLAVASSGCGAGRGG